MSTTSITQAQLATVNKIIHEYPQDPSVVWAALAGFGDQYAAAALVGLSNPNTLFGQVINNSNAVVGVSQTTKHQIAVNNVNGYLSLLNDISSTQNDGSIRLPSTGDIETNYSNALRQAGAPAAAAIDLSIGVLAANDVQGFGDNWYGYLWSVGLNLDPSRYSNNSPALDQVSYPAALSHVVETGLLTLVSNIGYYTLPKPLDYGEDTLISEEKAVFSAAHTLAALNSSGNLVNISTDPYSISNINLVVENLVVNGPLGYSLIIMNSGDHSSSSNPVMSAGSLLKLDTQIKKAVIGPLDGHGNISANLINGKSFVVGYDNGNTLTAGSSKTYLYAPGGNNTFYGNPNLPSLVPATQSPFRGIPGLSPTAFTSPTSSGAAGNPSGSPAASPTWDVEIAASLDQTKSSGSNTFYSSNGDNIIIGGSGTNTFNIDPLGTSAYSAAGTRDPVNIIWGDGGQSTYNLSNAAAFGHVSILYLPNATPSEVANLNLPQYDTTLGVANTVILNPTANDTFNISGVSIANILSQYSVYSSYLDLYFTPQQVTEANNGVQSGDLSLAYKDDKYLSAPSIVEFIGPNPSVPVSSQLAYPVISGLTDGIFGAHLLFEPPYTDGLGSIKDVISAESSPGVMAPFQGSGPLSGSDGTVYSLSANQGTQTVDNSVSATATTGGTVAFGSGVQLSDLAITVPSRGSTDVRLTGDGTAVTLTGELASSTVAPITAVTFADGTSLSYGAILAAVRTPSATNKAIYGDGGGNLLDSKGLATYAQGGGGGDTFVYKPGYRQIEINEQDSAANPSNVLSFGSGITSTQLAMSYDASGNLYLTDGTAGDQIKIDQQLNGPSFGVQSILFADGTTLSTAGLDPASLTLQGNTGTTGPDMLYGGASADTFDGKGAPAGSQDYEQGSGGADTFVFNQGYGHLEISEASTGSVASVLQFGPGITAAQLQLTTDSSGAAYLTDGTAGDQVKLDNYLNGPSSGPQTISFADGTSLTQAQVVAQATIGTTGADSLYGSTGADTFDGKGAPAGSQDYEQGNGGNDTFIYNQGYGQLEINEVGAIGNASVLQFGSGIAAGQVQVKTDGSGNVLLTDGTAGDQVTLDHYMNGLIYGPQTVAFADGTTWTQSQILAQLTTGTAGADTLYGTPGADIFDGKGAPLAASGSSSNPFAPPAPTPEDYEQGNGGADTFIYNQGYGQLEINSYSSASDVSTLQLGSGITAAQLQVTTDGSGNVYLADGTTGDLVKLDGYLFGASYGPQNIVFADGSTWTQAQVLVQATIGTAGADTLYGTSHSDTFDGKGAPAGSQDYEQGNGGADTFIYNQGYGQLEISEQGASGDASVLQLGSGIAIAQLQVTADRLGSVYLTDGTAGDQIKLDDFLNRSSYGPQVVSFADGTTWSRSQLIAQTTAGTTGADMLYGSTGADTFDGKGAPAGSQDYEQGNGGADTFVYNQGYGQLEINELSSSSDASVLQFGPRISPTQVQIVPNYSSKNLTLTDGVTGDQVQIDSFLTSPTYSPQMISFADGTIWTRAQIALQMTTGTVGADTINGTLEADVFDGKGAPVGSQDYEQGNGGADTFVYNQGYGALEINEYNYNQSSSALQFGSGITAAQIQVTADRSGDLLLTDGITNDKVKVYGYFDNNGHEIDNIKFTDGTIWTKNQVVTQENIGTKGADNLFGTPGSDIFDGKGTPAGSQDYEQGNGGSDTFVYNQGYGQLEISERGPNSDASVLQFGPGIIMGQIQVTTDSSGNLYLTDGTAGDQVKLDNYLNASLNGPQAVSFADGTNWTRAQTIAQATIGTVGADILYGTSNADTFDGKGAPSGSQDYEQGNGGADTFIYNQGYGQLEINETIGYESGISVVQIGAGITSSLLSVVGDSSGNVILTDGTSGDQVKIDNMLTLGYNGNVQYGVGELLLPDGTVISQQQILALATTGSAAADNLYGTTGADTLDGKGAPSGSQDYEQGNGGSDTFVYNQGYGALEINEDAGYNDTSAVLQLGAGITRAQLTATSNASGNLTLFDGTTGDQVTIDKMMNVTYYGHAEYGAAQILFADGSTLTSQQLRTLATTGTAGADSLYGGGGAEIFDGKGAPAGSQDYEQGNGGNDTFVYNQGYGQLEINEDAKSYTNSSAVLQLGPGVTPAQVTASADGSGNFILTDGINGDQIKIDGMMNLSSGSYSEFGVAQLQFADGTSWAQSQLAFLASTGTSGPDTINGTSGNDIIDGRGGTDMVSGNGGYDTYMFRQGYGALTIDNSVAGGTTPQGEIDFGRGITEQNLWFVQSGNNLLADVLGSQDVVNIRGWFSSDPTAQLAEIKAFDGMKLDSQVPQLVSAMASYQASNPGFDPTTAASMPNDPTLRAALASAWHS